MILQMMDYLRPIYEFRDRLFHTHAKDMKIDRAKLDDLGHFGARLEHAQDPGAGEQSIGGAWISALTDVGYQGPRLHRSGR